MRHLKIETWLFILALLLALGVRFYNLGAAPLSDAESEWALQALQVANPDKVSGTLEIGPQPAYILLTGVLFDLFGASNFLARFWPALAGSLLALVPFYLRVKGTRQPIGRYAALILAFGLALDPGLATISRMAGGPGMALGFGLSALGLWFAGIPILAGLMGGLALLSGPTFVGGALGLGLTWLIVRAAFTRSKDENLTRDKHLRIALFAGLITFLGVGTLFLRTPQGLAAWFESILVYLNGWRSPSGVPAARLAAALIFYQPFALIFALAGTVRWLIRLGRDDKTNPLNRGLPLIWLLLSLILALFYPGRQVTDLGWTLVPLWILASMELSEYVPKGKPHTISFLQAGLALLFAGLFWMTLIATNQMVPVEGISWDAVRLAVLAGVLLLGILTTALVALGWSWPISRDGAVWGVSIAFGIYSLMVLWSASQLRPNYPGELWSSSPAIQQADLFDQTIEDLSKWETGFIDQIEIVSTVDVPSMRWQLRSFPKAQFLTQPPPGELPDVVITLGENESSQSVDFPALNAAYRGQDFAWWLYPGWNGVLPPDTIRWLAFREAPLLRRQIILWARSDIFPGGTIEPAPEFDEFDEAEYFETRD